MNDLSLYNIYRPEIKTWDMFAYVSREPLGQIIRWWSPGANHISGALSLDEYCGEEDRRWTLEAGSKGVCLELLSRVLEHYPGDVWWYPLDVDDDVRRIIGEEALNRVGYGYDYFGIIRNMFSRVSINAARYFCSEYYWDPVRDAWFRYACGHSKQDLLDHWHLEEKNMEFFEDDVAPRPSDVLLLPLYKKPVLLIESKPLDTTVVVQP